MRKGLFFVGLLFFGSELYGGDDFYKLDKQNKVKVNIKEEFDDKLWKSRMKLKDEAPMIISNAKKEMEIANTINKIIINPKLAFCFSNHRTETVNDKASAKRELARGSITQNQYNRYIKIIDKEDKEKQLKHKNSIQYNTKECKKLREDMGASQ